MGEKLATDRLGRTERLSTLERREKAVQLRVLGYTYDRIARELDYSSGSNAQRAIRRHLDLMQNSPAAQELRQIEYARLEQLRRSWVQLGTTGHDPKAAKILLDTSAQVAKLMGLNVNEAKIAGAMEAGAAADLARASMVNAHIIGAMQDAGLEPAVMDLVIANLNRRLELADQTQAEPEDDGLTIEGEVDA